MKLLLDTHVLLWWLSGDSKSISNKAANAIGAGDAHVAISAVSIWEIAIKRGLGKLDAPDDLLDQLERSQVELLPITARHADLVASLPTHHRDPFDRLLIAQAIVEELALVTADKAFKRYDVEVVW